MDNLAHTLVGAALGRAVAGHRIPRAAFLGAIAANAPDWTEIFVGLPGESTTYLVVHRGITHSLYGAGLQIVALTLVAALGMTWRARRRGGIAPPWPWIAACVAATVLSHLLMDWQGSYGLRPFLPWSDRWYYGDFVAIVDVFFWLVPLLALAWGARRHWIPILVLAAVGGPIALAVVRAEVVALWVKLGCGILCLVGAVGWVRHWFGVAGRRRAAAWAIALLALYAGAQAGASVPVKAAVRRQAEQRFGPAARWAALTEVGRPFTWEPVYASGDTVAGPDWRLPRRLDRPAVQRALRGTPEGRAMAQFARFLAADVDSGPGAVTVYLRDARYARTARNGWGVLAVRME